MISLKEFERSQSVWQSIYKHLKKEGFDVYSPGMKTGECISEYLVIKNDSSTKHQSFSTDVDLYTVMCYVPKDSYSKLEPYVQQVKKAMKGLKPLVLPYGMQTPSYYDDTYKAHTISIMYKNNKKI